MSKFNFKPKYFLLGLVLGSAATYSINYYQDKSHKEPIKKEISKLTHEIDSINNAATDATSKLSYELDVLSAMNSTKYKVASDSIRREMDGVNNNTQSQIAARQQKIAELAKQIVR